NKTVPVSPSISTAERASGARSCSSANPFGTPIAKNRQPMSKEMHTRERIHVPSYPGLPLVCPGTGELCQRHPLSHETADPHRRRLPRCTNTEMPNTPARWMGSCRLESKLPFLNVPQENLRNVTRSKKRRGG